MPQSIRATRFFIAAVLSCVFMLGGRAEACTVCFPIPQKTATDWLLRADVVVLARENAEKPFSYVAVEVLKGELDDPGIDLFVDSTTRRYLTLSPDDSVVLVFDTEAGSWRSAGYATPAYRSVVVKILARESEWERFGGAQDRARFFLPYLANADHGVRELSFLEVGQAPYDTIREADHFVPAEQVYRLLADPRYIEWHAFYILLLGVDANPSEKETIRAALANTAKFNQKSNLSAWATAFIEIDGEVAIDWLETAYLGDPERDPEAVLEIVNALSVQGSLKRSGLRIRIAESYKVLIQTHSSLAGAAARDLTAWSDWRFADILAQLRESRSEIDAATAYAIDRYIGLAQSNASN